MDPNILKIFSPGESSNGIEGTSRVTSGIKIKDALAKIENKDAAAVISGESKDIALPLVDLPKNEDETSSFNPNSG